MVYAIIAIVTVIALFLIFRDDHDTSYNKNEKRGHGAERSQYDKKSEPRTEFHREDVKDKVLNVVESIIKEVKEQTAEPMKEVQRDLQKAVDEAKGAFEKAMRDAGQKGYWTSSSDVDEQEQPEAEEPSEEDLSFLDNLDYYEDLEENTETFDITGLRYYCTVHDCGKVVGVVKPEPSNVHDSRAQAVIRSDGKMLGYIPKTQLDWYEDFNEEDVVCPFVGEIEIDGRGWMQAEIKVIIPSSIEFVRYEIECEL